MKSKYDKIDELIRGYGEQNYFTQAVYALFDRDGIIHLGTFGGAGEEAQFDLASLTKLFTTTLILKLVEEKRLSLMDCLNKHLEIPASCPKLMESFRQITVFELLTHTSGLLAWYPFYSREAGFYEILEDILSLPLEKGRVVYSDINYILLGKLAEAILKLPLEQAMEEKVRGPLEIERLCYCPPGANGLKGAVVSSYDNKIEEEMCREQGITFLGFRKHGQPIRGEANDGNCWYYMKGISGHAGLFSDIQGVCTLGSFYLNAGDGIFADAQKEGALGRGLGFELGELYPEGCGHTGFTGTSLYISRKYGIGGALLTNRLTGQVAGTAPDLKELRKEYHQMVRGLR